MDMLAKARELHDELTAIRHKIHQNPELGFQEFETTRLVKEYLEAQGITVVPLKAATGVLGVLEGGKGPGNVTALRADMDALPIRERTGLPYQSVKDGIMHACGHDGHTAILLGVAKVLAGMRHKLSGVIKFIFQPAEELIAGAKVMVAEGVLEHPAVDTVVALHCWPFLEVGKVGLYDGPYMASADSFSVKVLGRGTHGAYPHRGVDSVLTACHVVVALQEILSREVDALDRAVLSVCAIQGGKTFNVIPEEVTLLGTVRCQSEQVRKGIPEKMERIIKGVTAAFGCGYSFEYSWGVPQLVNDAAVNAEIARAADQALGPGYVDSGLKPPG